MGLHFCTIETSVEVQNCVPCPRGVGVQDSPAATPRRPAKCKTVSARAVSPALHWRLHAVPGQLCRPTKFGRAAWRLLIPVRNAVGISPVSFTAGGLSLADELDWVESRSRGSEFLLGVICC